MVLGNPGLQRYVAEDPTLERLRSSHISPLGLPSKVPFDEEFFSSLLGARRDFRGAKKLPQGDATGSLAQDNRASAPPLLVELLSSPKEEPPAMLE